MATTAPEIYTTVRQQLLDLADHVDASQAATSVPALPLWTVRDSYAHLVGNVTDTLEGNVANQGHPDWTAAQLATRAGHTLTQLCQEWSRTSEEFDVRMRSDQQAWGNAFDLWLHEQDIRAALGHSVDREEQHVRFGLNIITPAANSWWPADAPAVSLKATDLGGEWQLGEGAVAATISADGYELLRAVSGRRSRAQVAALGWSDPAPHLANTPVFGFAEQDLIE